MPRRRLKPFDWFMLLNTTIFVLTVGSTYYTAELEFGLYAVVLLMAGAFGWRFLRRFDYPVWLLVLAEVGLAAHFAGGYVKFGPEEWLYWHHILGVRYDKIVHFFNSFVAVLAFATIFRGAGLRLKTMEPFILVVLVLGLGAVIEIIEYFAVVIIQDVGVGDYANNMEDLVMNLLGGLLGIGVMAVAKRLRRGLAEAVTEDV